MQYYDERTYTDDELIVRIWDKEQIKDLMGRRAFYYANNQRRRELSELWVAKTENRRTASFGRNWGYYVGMDEIEKYYIIKYNEKQYEGLRKINRHDPSVIVDNKNLGYGCAAFHTVTTPMIYIAGDGRTARGLWYSPGFETNAKGDGEAEASWTFANMAADFVKEDGQWKIWHLVIANDYYVEAGADFSAGSVDVLPGQDIFEAEFGAPTIPMTVHNPRYNWSDNYPPMPLPYYTFTDAASYGPEGHPAYKEVRK